MREVAAVRRIAHESTTTRRLLVAGSHGCFALTHIGTATGTGPFTQEVVWLWKKGSRRTVLLAGAHRARRRRAAQLSLVRGPIGLVSDARAARRGRRREAVYSVRAVLLPSGGSQCI